MNKDHTILRELASEYRNLCDSQRNQEKIDLWRRLNSIDPKRPVVWCNLGLLGPDIDRALPQRRVEDDELAGVEHWLQKMLWSAGIGDDRVFYPWYTVRAEMLTLDDSDWGIPRKTVRDPASRGWRDMPVLHSESDLAKLKSTPHKVLDSDPPFAQKLRGIFGDTLDVHINRATVYRMWGGTDLSESAGRLLGLSELMYALYDSPDLVHRVMAFMRDSVLSNVIQCEKAGDFSTVETENYLVPAYCDDLPDPQANSHGASMKDLCFFTHSQEFECVGPEQHKEFLLDYQMPIMARYGKVAYGCCETLDTKINILRTIPNLHKVLAGPLADITLYPEKLGDRYVISWRPNAAPMVCRGFDPEGVRSFLRGGLEATKGCPIEVHLHEPMTVEGDLSRVTRWAEIAIQEAERVA